ncbi:hypothetical protein Ddc_12129 [Ditylenchus destructor]|nr:hypothetical protein Ddc_12129 [Ditylenchus destructor]
MLARTAARAFLRNTSRSLAMDSSVARRQIGTNAGNMASEVGAARQGITVESAIRDLGRAEGKNELLEAEQRELKSQLRFANQDNEHLRTIHGIQKGYTKALEDDLERATKPGSKLNPFLLGAGVGTLATAFALTKDGETDSKQREYYLTIKMRFKKRLGKMSMPEDILLSVFKYLTRYNLDAVEICCRPYRNIVQRNLGRLPLRTIDEVEYNGSSESNPSDQDDSDDEHISDQGSLDVEVGDDINEKSENETNLSVTGNGVSHDFNLHTDLERGINCLSYSFICEFTIRDHCESLQSHAILTSPGMVIDLLTVVDYYFRLGRSHTIDRLLSGCKFQGLDIGQSAIPGSQINDHFLQELGRGGTNRVQLRNIHEGKYMLSEDAIVDYCFFAEVGNKPRTLILTDVSITPPFLGKCIKASKRSTVTSNVELYIAKIIERMLIPAKYDKFITLNTRNLGLVDLVNPELDLEDIKAGMRLKIVTKSKIFARRNGRGGINEKFQLWMRFGKKEGNSDFFDNTRAPEG